MGNEVKTGGPRLKAPGVGWLIHTLGGGVSIEAESFSVALLRNKRINGICFGRVLKSNKR